MAKDNFAQLDLVARTKLFVTEKEIGSRFLWIITSSIKTGDRLAFRVCHEIRLT